MKKILLVEDNSALRLIELRYLRHSIEDVDFFAVGSIEEAVVVAKTYPLEAVILDCGLPDASGIVTIERMLSHCPNAFFVITSAKPPPVEQLQAVGRRHQVLVKPFEPETLVTLVQRMLSPPDTILSPEDFNQLGKEDLRSTEKQRHDILNILGVALAEICAMELDLLSDSGNPIAIRTTLEQDIPELKQTVMLAAEKVKNI